MENVRNENLYGWVFKYNPYEDKWMAAQDSNYFALTNGTNEEVLKVSGIENFSTLLWIINVTNGDKTKIQELLDASPEIKLVILGEI